MDAALLRSLDVRRVGSLRSSFLFTGTIIVLRSCKKILRSLEVCGPTLFYIQNTRVEFY